MTTPRKGLRGPVVPRSRAMGSNLPPRETDGKVVLDWKAYFLEFCRLHGEPVESGGRLIFRDGWSYSASEYEGPEYPPPASLDELDKIVVSYWTARLGTLNRTLPALVLRLSKFEEMERNRSLPIQQSVLVQEKNGKNRKGYRPLNLAPLRERIAWMRSDIEECECRLKEIEQFQRDQRSTNEHRQAV